MNADRRKGIADDVAVLKLKASLRDVNGVPLAAAGLMQGEVADSPDAGLKVNRIASASANDHIP